MFKIHFMNHNGLTGFFLPHPSGAFTIGRDGFSWVTNDLMGMDRTLRGGLDVAHSALIQGF